MRKAAIAGLLALCCAGAVAAAAQPDARNPYHCAFALSVAYDLSKERHGADSEVTRELKDRYIWQAMRSAMLPHMEPKAEDGEAMRLALAENPEAGLTMADNCIRRQDVDPRYLATRPTAPLPGGLTGVLPGEVDHAALAIVFGPKDTPPTR